VQNNKATTKQADYYESLYNRLARENGGFTELINDYASPSEFKALSVRDASDAINAIKELLGDDIDE